MEKFIYIVYKITNNINQKIYIGLHKCREDLLEKDSYMGSGKLIKKAIKKYGIKNFKRDIMFIYDNIKDAETKEREIVNEDFVERDDTYNLVIGGNVLILKGEKNGFFGKKHTEETKEKMVENKKKTCDERGYGAISNWHCVINNVEFFNKKQVCEFYNIHINNNFKLLSIIFENNGKFIIDNNEMVLLYETMLNTRETNLLKKKESTKKRFKDKKKSEEHKKKIGLSNAGKKHDWQDKINKNPEKIEKTRISHLGKKRGIKQKQNIRKAIQNTFKNGRITHNKGKIAYHNIKTGEIIYIEKADDNILTNDWVRGTGKRK
jgi:hypothetical protein